MLCGEEQRALERARVAARARRKEANRARYFRYVQRRDPRFARGVSRTADPMLHLMVFGNVTVRRGSIVRA